MNNTILSLGLILLFGFIFSRIINKIKFPSVTAYLLLGIIIGPCLFNLVSGEIIASSGFVSNIVLGLIAFSIGQNFSRENLRRIGKPVIWISLFEAAGAWILVTLVFFLILRKPFYLSLLFGAISSATAPAATVMVLRETRAKGRFADILLGVVAIDDAWCLIIFALSLALAKAMAAHISSNLFIFKIIINSILQIGGAFIIGWLIGLLASYFSKYIRTQTELLIYSLGFIFFTIGLSILMHFSVLLACMSLGASLINLKRTNLNFFDAIKAIDPPLYLLFFVLAGANLELPLLKNIGFIGIIYLVFRIFGKIGGAYLGGTIAKVSHKIRRYLGFGLIPQAGVALGCALIAKSDFPLVGGLIFTTIVATTVIYELVGPICTKIAIEKAGEIS
ncbi:MAG: cation:proton antiporter [Candidatus Omnitrophica bacterium]|nr:cation:proton antiporter [Candidatus Omnitrophota bacterium]